MRLVSEIVAKTGDADADCVSRCCERGALRWHFFGFVNVVICVECVAWSFIGRSGTTRWIGNGKQLQLSEWHSLVRFFAAFGARVGNCGGRRLASLYA